MYPDYPYFPVLPDPCFTLITFLFPPTKKENLERVYLADIEVSC